MKTKEDILKTLREEFPFLKERYGVRKVGLFGSYSRGEAGEESDIDLLVEFERPIGFFGFIGLEEYLKERLGAKVELVTEEALKPLVKPRVMKEAVYV